jgi:hypothetical protein
MHRLKEGIGVSAYRRIGAWRRTCGRLDVEESWSCSRPVGPEWIRASNEFRSTLNIGSHEVRPTDPSPTRPHADTILRRVLILFSSDQRRSFAFDNSSINHYVRNVLSGRDVVHHIEHDFFEH